MLSLSCHLYHGLNRSDTPMLSFSVAMKFNRCSSLRIKLGALSIEKHCYWMVLSALSSSRIASKLLTLSRFRVAGRQTCE